LHYEITARIAKPRELGQYYRTDCKSARAGEKQALFKMIDLALANKKLKEDLKNLHSCPK